MADDRESLTYYGYKSINEYVSSESTPLLEILLKLSSIASNFASAANNVKNVSVSENRQLKELLELVFEVRKLSEKVEEVVEDRVERQLCLIKSGVFDKAHEAHHRSNVTEEVIKDAIVVGAVVGAAKEAAEKKREERINELNIETDAELIKKLQDEGKIDKPEEPKK